MHNIGNGSNRTLVYDGKIAGLYDLEETLGSGHFAVVKLARHVFTGEKVAVKVIDKTKLDEVSRSHLFQEVRCMKLVQHPNVVRLYEVIDTQTKLYLILELGDGGDLYDYIMKHEGGLSENLAREYFRQIVRAISYCHKLHVVHRDLKPENVVFFEKLGVVKLTDFGFSNKFCPGQKLETSCGSLAYSAPEILLGDSYDAPAVDIWSLGVILYMLVCGNPPFEKANDSETLTMIMDCKYTMPPHVSQGCRKLIDSMLVRAPEKRATLEQIAHDPWLIENINSSIQSQQQQQESNIPELLPLVSRQQVSDDDHSIIIKKMVNGQIATKEEILDALDRNEYNHITATYFLMAERKLRLQRLDQMQKRRPDLSLPVTTNSQLSPRSRIQGIKNMQSNRDANNQLLIPTSSQLNAPRTPGAETTTGGRTRKCSIVQEEEDDEDEIPNCTKRDELMAPINRRGSRSEGRINLAIQDKVVQNNERIKNNIYTGQQKGIENISGIKVINNDTNNIRMRLGKSGASNINSNNHHNQQQQNRIINPPPIEITKTYDTNLIDDTNSSNSGIITKTNQININEPPINIDTKYLIDSSTITLPIINNTIINDIHTNAIPKYKTMPSPTRPNIILSGPRQLNEIFEEGTDIGSSDTSTTTTPRPLIRSAHFTTTNRGNSSSSSSNNSSVVGHHHHHHHHHRRTKFHKNRTPSCSSSDASDDDSESRKKRAHKMPDIIKPLQSQRRDSHDDSSDSQEPGNNPSTSSNTNSSVSYLINATTTTNGSGNNNNNNSNNNENRNENGGTSSGSGRCETIIDGNINGQTFIELSENNINTNSWHEDSFNSNDLITSQKTEQQQQLNNYRRHRNGRRRASETRLRESQSLNRITEVQESEMPINYNNNTNNQNSQSTSNSNDSTILKDADDNDPEIIESLITIPQKDNEIIVKTSTIIKNSIPQTTNNNIVQQSITTPTTTTKSKGFSARLFQGFIRNKNNDSKNINNSTIQSQQQQQPQITTDSHSADDVDIVLGVEYTKPIRVNDTTTTSSTTKTSSATKKLKMLGKYFQVHKKICIPLPGLFQRAAGGRLYKAQSCGSIVHNRVNQNSLNSTTTTSSSSTTTKNPLLLNTRHSVLYTTTTSSTTTPTPSSVTDKQTTNNIKYIKNKSLGGSRFLNSSDSDINQNNNDNNCYKTTTTIYNNLSNSNNISLSSPSSQIQQQDELTSKTLIFSNNADIITATTTTPNNQINNEFKPSTFNLMSSTSSTMATTLLAAQNNICNNSCSSSKSSNNCNNLSNNSKIILTSSSSATSKSSPLHHQLNDVPLCSSKC